MEKRNEPTLGMYSRDWIDCSGLLIDTNTGKLLEIKHPC